MRSDHWFVSIQGKGKSIMRTILLSFIAAMVLLGGLSSCSTSVKTDSGHGVTAGVH
jgi:high-affinity Fe2+/Pb2+ permease